MGFRLTSEDQLLDIEVRQRIIKEIVAPENRIRKDEAFKRYQCYKDGTYLYVIRQLLRQFDAATVNEMAYALSNIGLVRKIIDKLARVYKYGVSREVVGDEATTKVIQTVTKECDIDQVFKKTNRFLKLEKNCVQYIVPKPYDLKGDKKTIKTLVLAPHLYDAIELTDDRERPVCYILSDYKPYMGSNNNFSTSIIGVSSPTPEKHGPGIIQFPVIGDSRDQTIADRPEDQKTNRGHYIFWSDSYHFTCDEKGQIITDESQGGSADISNPIGEMPFINYAEDQDGAFWAIGGNDLVDGAILVNAMITNINHIAITQGYGQIVMSGKELPTAIKVGPNKIVRMNYQEGDPVPSFEFKNANPPLSDLGSLVEMYTALLLSTNNLSSNGVSTNLKGGAQFPSGIAMMIDKAESMEDVEDQRQIFIDNEPRFWDVFAKWHRVLKSQNVLCDELQALTFPDKFEVSTQWEEPKPIETEADRLTNLQLKFNLGLVTREDMLRSEYPDMTDDELKKKLEEIMKEKMDAMMQAQEAMGGSQGSQNNQDGNSFGNGSGGDGRGQGSGGGVPSGTDPKKRPQPPKPGNGGPVPGINSQVQKGKNS